MRAIAGGETSSGVVSTVTSGVVTVFSAVNKGTMACLGAATAAGYGVYNVLIRNPLRIFYFVGPIWRNAPPAEICYELTGVKAAWWEENQDRIEQCIELLERRFSSFDATVMTTAYFTVMTFVVMQLLCRCCFVRPLMAEWRRRVD